MEPALVLSVSAPHFCSLSVLLMLLEMLFMVPVSLFLPRLLLDRRGTGVNVMHRP